MGILITDRAVFTTHEISIRCAHCKGKHGSVAEVRACSMITTQTGIKTEPITEPGMYALGSDVFLVELSRNNHLYARKLVATMQGAKVHKLTFEYEKGAIFKLTAAMRMTPEAVAALGKTTGHCWVCARKLTVQKSIDAGIGPVCAKKV